MQDLANKRVLVVGLGASGRAASELLRRREAKVLAIEKQSHASGSSINANQSRSATP